MNRDFLQDDALILRAPEMSDLETLFAWENDSSLWHVGNTIAPYTHRQLYEYIDTYEADIFKSRQLRFVIMEKESERCVGVIDLFDFEPINRHASLGILISADDRGKGYACKAISLLCNYCGTHLGIHSLTAVTEKTNQSAINLFRKCGFDTCGCLRSWIRRGNVYNDAVLFQILFK